MPVRATRSRLQRFGPWLCIIVMILVLMPSTAQAKQVSGSVIIGNGEYYGWRMDIVIPSTIEYNITCLNLTPISVLVLDEANYTRFVANQTFDYYPAYSFVNVSAAQINMTVLSGTVYIVVDNSNRSLAMSNDSARDEVEVVFWIGSSFALDSVPDQGSTLYVYGLVALLFVVLVLVIYSTRKAIKNRKK